MENNNNVAAMNELLEKTISHLTNEDYEIAIDLFEQAYKLQCEALSENDPDTLKALYKLATSYKPMGDEISKRLLEKIYALNCKAFGERSFAALKTLEALAATYGSLGNHEKKRELKEIIESTKHSTTHIYLTKNTEQLQIIALSKKLGDETLISAREKAKNYKFDDNGKLIVDITYQEAFDAYEKTIEYYTMAYRLQFLLYGENEHPEVKGTLESLIKAYKELLSLENTFESLLREYKGLIKVGSKSYSALEERLEFYQAIFDEIK